jgi:hypothetical protein
MNQLTLRNPAVRSCFGIGWASGLAHPIKDVENGQGTLSGLRDMLNAVDA